MKFKLGPNFGVLAGVVFKHGYFSTCDRSLHGPLNAARRRHALEYRWLPGQPLCPLCSGKKRLREEDELYRTLVGSIRAVGGALPDKEQEAEIRKAIEENLARQWHPFNNNFGLSHHATVELDYSPKAELMDTEQAYAARNGNRQSPGDEAEIKSMIEVIKLAGWIWTPAEFEVLILQPDDAWPEAGEERRRAQHNFLVAAASKKQIILRCSEGHHRVQAARRSGLMPYIPAVCFARFVKTHADGEWGVPISPVGISTEVSPATERDERRSFFHLRGVGYTSETLPSLWGIKVLLPRTKDNNYRWRKPKNVAVIDLSTDD